MPDAGPAYAANEQGRHLSMRSCRAAAERPSSHDAVDPYRPTILDCRVWRGVPHQAGSVASDRLADLAEISGDRAGHLHALQLSG
jgi:hypothetical protein